MISLTTVTSWVLGRRLLVWVSGLSETECFGHVEQILANCQCSNVYLFLISWICVTAEDHTQDFWMVVDILRVGAAVLVQDLHLAGRHRGTRTLVAVPDRNRYFPDQVAQNCHDYCQNQNCRSVPHQQLRRRGRLLYGYVVGAGSSQDVSPAGRRRHCHCGC